MDKFEYKVLWNKRSGILAEHWFDGELDLGPNITTEVMAPYGLEGWEVAVAMNTIGGTTHKLILKRRVGQ